jgi:hypothetical protein
MAAEVGHRQLRILAVRFVGETPGGTLLWPVLDLSGPADLLRRTIRRVHRLRTLVHHRPHVL